MRKHVIAPIAAGVLLAVAGTAQSATKSTTFQVTANVSQNCVISASPLAFGIFNGTNDLANSTPITVYCTSGTAFAVGLNDGLNASAGLRRMAGTGTDYLAYNLYTTNAYSTVWDTSNTVPGTGSGMTTAQTLTVYGRLLASDNTGAVGAGSYADTVTATITY